MTLLYKFLIICILIVPALARGQAMMNISRKTIKHNLESYNYKYIEKGNIIVADAGDAIIKYHMSNDICNVTEIYPKSDESLKYYIARYDIKYLSVTPDTWIVPGKNVFVKLICSEECHLRWENNLKYTHAVRK